MRHCTWVNVRWIFLSLWLLSQGPVAYCAQGIPALQGTSTQQRADSLQRELYGTEGAGRVELLNALSWELKFLNPTRAYRLALEARTLAKQQQDRPAIALSTKHMGVARTMQGLYSEALTLIFEEIEMRRALGDTAAIASGYNNIGYILKEQENYDLALEYFYRALRLTEQEIYLPDLQAVTLNNIGQIHRAKGQLQLAEEALLRSLEVLKQVPDQEFIVANNLNDLGTLSLRQDNFEEALSYFRRSYRIELRLGNTLHVAQSLNYLALAHLEQGNLDSAEVYVREGLALAESLENKQQENQLSKTAAEVYAARGDYATAYRYSTRHSHLNDSLITVGNQQRLQSLENRFVTAQEQNEMDLMQEREARSNSELYRARLMRNGALVVTALVLTALVLLLVNNRLRRRNNRALLAQKEELSLHRDALEEANEHLTKVNSEMDNFMYRVSHDLRSPLTSLMGLIKLASEENDSTKRDQYLKLMNKSVTKLDAFIGDIIDLTRNSRQALRYESFSIKPMLEDFFEQYMYHDGRKDITCELEMKGLKTLVTDQYRLGVILGNLIGNAVIYSKDYREDAVVKITTQIDEERAIIQVRDNGPGIAPEHQERIFDMFFRSSNTTNGSGLGLYIVRETVHKLGGSIRVVSESRHGSTFIVEVPNQKLGTEHHPPTTDLSQVLNA